MTAATIEGGVTEKVRRFVQATFPASRQAALPDDASLLDGGIVDSLGILEIVGFLESELGLALGDDDVVVENFQSVAAIARFAEARLNRAGDGGAAGL